MGKKRKRNERSTDGKLKLAPLPDIRKRPLLRNPVPSRYAGAASDKIVYISTKTPFMSAVKRVEKLLDIADKREAQSALASVRRQQDEGRGNLAIGNKRGRPDLDEAAALLAGEVTHEGGQIHDQRDTVVLKGTGRAIEKTLGVALFFQQREGYVVRLRTASITAIDDIVEKVGDASNGEQPSSSSALPSPEHAGTAADQSRAVAEVPSTRLRYTSAVEAHISRAS